MPLPFDNEQIDPPKINELGHTGMNNLVLTDGEELVLSSLIKGNFSSAWASFDPPVCINGIVTNFVSFMPNSTELVISKPTTINIYWK